MNQVATLLSARYPVDIVENVIKSYVEVESNYRLGKWKPSELDAGHFVESVRRILEFELLNNYTPFSKSIDKFNETALSKYENAKGNESFRILIPRVLYSVYCIRNKRGVGHVSEVPPNEIDATYILYSVKWVLAEIIRIVSKVSIEEVKILLSKIVERHIDLIWDDGTSFLILDKKIKTGDKVLLVLYKKDSVKDQDIQTLVKYTNRTYFNKILNQLKKDLLIDQLKDGRCRLSPLGIKRVEEQILAKKGIK
jgi:hypothetical protein